MIRPAWASNSDTPITDSATKAGHGFTHHMLILQYDDVSEYGPIGAIVLVYSITSQQSFQFVNNQLQDVRTAADQTPVIVVANKTDLVRSRQVSEDGQ